MDRSFLLSLLLRSRQLVESSLLLSVSPRLRQLVERPLVLSFSILDGRLDRLGWLNEFWRMDEGGAVDFRGHFDFSGRLRALYYVILQNYFFRNYFFELFLPTCGSLCQSSFSNLDLRREA